MSALGYVSHPFVLYCCLLYRKLLVFNPSKRLSPEQALRHPYVAQFHNTPDEPSAGKVFVLPISDNTKYTVGEYRWGQRGGVTREDSHF